MSVDEFVQRLVVVSDEGVLYPGLAASVMRYTIDQLADPHCPGSADVLAEIQRRRDAAMRDFDVRR